MWDPYQVDTEPHLIRGAQTGYNICNSTTQNQDSLCQTSFVNSIDDFCLWAPIDPGSVVGDIEGEMVAWCTKPGHGTRLIPRDALQGVQFMRTPDYVQVIGFIDQTKINILAGDWGGEMDPHGADLRGNPLGGLLYSNAWSGSDNNRYNQVIEWHNFIGGNAFCIKACDPSKPNAAKFCEHIFDRIGCAYNAPNRAQNGTFESCEGENQDFPGTYVQDGVTMTYTQPPESLGAISTMPYTARVPESSNCVAHTSSVVFAALASVTAPGESTSAAAPTGTGAAGSSGTSKPAAPGSGTGTGTAAGAGSTGNAAGTIAVSDTYGVIRRHYARSIASPRAQPLIQLIWIPHCPASRVCMHVERSNVQISMRDPLVLKLKLERQMPVDARVMLQRGLLRPPSIYRHRRSSLSPTLLLRSRALMTTAAQETPAKRQKLQQVIGTHNGTFHCDEALAVFLLRRTNKYRDAGLKRTRDPALLDTCDIVVDVGAVYDEGKQRFDHHQRGFAEVFGHGFETKLSSAGLVYNLITKLLPERHFGREVVANTVQLPLDDPKVETLWLKVYREFIEAIDAIDNGIPQYPSELKPKYRSRTDLSSRVAALNPAWNQPADAQTLDALFDKASLLTGEEFLGKLNYYASAWLPARDILVASVAQSKENVDPTGKIVLFEQFLPWKEHLFELEADPSSNINAGDATYVVYPDEMGGNWRVQAVPVSPESFESRKALPEKWRGLRDEELSTASGIPGGIFIHASGFIGGNKTKEGALQLARAALLM
ncbi:hypothetical protein D9615_009046 [Tricholomella constricta]|uniref:Metal-dependent protein hydrolase n=1 Tax=Tricholomella constricta TaxID=117010 RepID=A0A8H5H0R0_9AGAR|nr:hypothetical protein D9615_009046 [Tricholomella constricta]